MIIVAITFLALISMAALAIDAGQLWWNRRSLVVDTDAAALAAANHARSRVVAGAACDSTDLLSGKSAADVAEDVIAENDATTQFDKGNPAQFSIDCTDGTVSVAAVNNQAFAFAPVMPGIGTDADVYARSTAKIGPFVAMDKLRPLPVCVNGTAANPSAYEAWQAGSITPPVWMGPTVSGHIYKVVVDNAAFKDLCNPSGLSASGGFRWIDFDGTESGSHGRPCLEGDPAEPAGSGTAELRFGFEFGYPCQVYLNGYDDGTNVGPNCRPDPGGAWEVDSCPSGDGVSTSSLKCIKGDPPCSVNQVCADIVTTPATSCPHIWTLLLYDELLPDPTLPSPANENQPRFRPSGFVSAVVRKVGTDASDFYVGLEFLSTWTGTGVMGPLPAGAPAHNLGIRLCGAEAELNCD